MTRQVVGDPGAAVVTAKAGREVDVVVEAGEADPDRVESFRRLLAAREGASDW